MDGHIALRLPEVGNFILATGQIRRPLHCTTRLWLLWRWSNFVSKRNSFSPHQQRKLSVCLSIARKRNAKDQPVISAMSLSALSSKRDGLGMTGARESAGSRMSDVRRWWTCRLEHVNTRARSTDGWLAEQNKPDGPGTSHNTVTDTATTSHNNTPLALLTRPIWCQTAKARIVGSAIDYCDARNWLV